MSVVVSAFSLSGHMLGDAADRQAGGGPDGHAFEGLSVLVVSDDRSGDAAKGRAGDRVVRATGHRCGVGINGTTPGRNIGVV